MTESDNFCIAISAVPSSVFSMQRSPDGFTLDLYEGAPGRFTTRGGGDAGVPARVAQLNGRKEETFETIRHSVG